MYKHRLQINDMIKNKNNVKQLKLQNQIFTFEVFIHYLLECLIIIIYMKYIIIKHTQKLNKVLIIINI